MILAFIFSFLSAAYAFDLEPEYQGLNEAEIQNFTRPYNIDAEYQSVLNAYTAPYGWQTAWQNAKQAFELSVGSISGTRFYIYDRAKFQVPLTERLSFRFTYFEQRDREIDQVRHVLELNYKLNSWSAISVYGEPSSFKRENDMGVAVITKWNEIANRLYYTSHDLTRAGHNDQADYYANGTNPQSYGWTSTWSFGRAGFRYDQPITWVRPQEQRLFYYSKKLIFLDLEWQKWTARVQWDSTLKAQDPLGSTSGVASENWLEKRTFIRLGHLIELPRYSVEPALMYATREWTARGAKKVSHLNVLPAVTMRFESVRRESDFDHIQLGYEMNVFRTYGDLSLTTDEQKHEGIEGRLQTAYEFSLQKASRLMVALNFDVDQWSPAPTFEGGNCQFRAEF